MGYFDCHCQLVVTLGFEDMAKQNVCWSELDGAKTPKQLTIAFLGAKSVGKTSIIKVSCTKVNCCRLYKILFS